MISDFLGIQFYDFCSQGMRIVKDYLGEGEYYCPLIQSKYEIDFDYYCSWNEQTISEFVNARKMAGLDIKTGQKLVK